MKLITTTALALSAGLMFMPAALAQEEIRETSCHIIAQNGDDPRPLIDVSILDRAADRGEFSLSLPDDMDVGALLCFRNTAVPGPDDWEVVLAGYPLYITERRPDGEDLTTLLEITPDAQFQIRVIYGSLTSAQRAQATQRLESYYAAANSGM